ncbi:MAG: type VI secretion system protein TssA [Myxococcales bacterium]|nr:type VI secretion system protein TssA [Myxococcales bacterium]
MAVIDIEGLLEAVSAESPCGEDLEYDAELLALTNAAQGSRGEGMFDDGGEDGPDWAAIKKNALKLFSRTKDVRVGMILCKALCNTDGIEGLADGVECLHGLLGRYWDGVHPMLDPDDGDATMRLNSLIELTRQQGLIADARRAPLVRFAPLGKFGLRDIELASGELTLPEGSDETPPSRDAVEGAFLNCELELLQATRKQLASTLERAQQMEAQILEKLGTGQAVRFEALTAFLGRAGRVLDQKLEARGAGAEATAAETDAEEGQAGGGGAATSAGGRATAAVSIGSLTVNGRDDVVRLLDKINDYYARSEPSSPVPVLLQRCKRLVTMDFKQIIEDLIPDGMSQFETIRGPAAHDED